MARPNRGGVAAAVVFLVGYGWLYNPKYFFRDEEVTPEARHALDTKRQYLKKEIKLSRSGLQQTGSTQSFSFNLTVYNNGNKDVKDIHIICRMFRSYGEEIGTLKTTFYIDFKAKSQRQINDIRTSVRRDLGAVDCEVVDALVVNN
ncbi:hypothetical protein [Methylorubrum sp. SB2]|uniref:hypothetical protein n=1 Tax=Methylorubrum subtropicum TaxID=3138812 RepID=UPI00313A857C